MRMRHPSAALDSSPDTYDSIPLATFGEIATDLHPCCRESTPFFTDSFSLLKILKSVSGMGVVTRTRVLAIATAS